MKEFIEKLISRLEEKIVEITFPLYPDDMWGWHKGRNEKIFADEWLQSEAE